MEKKYKFLSKLLFKPCYRRRMRDLGSDHIGWKTASEVSRVLAGETKTLDETKRHAREALLDCLHYHDDFLALEIFKNDLNNMNIAVLDCTEDSPSVKV